MKGTERDEFIGMKKDVAYVKEQLDHLQENVGERFDKIDLRLSTLIKEVNNSAIALRNDINLANQQNFENKKRVENLEKEAEKNNTELNQKLDSISDKLDNNYVTKEALNQRLKLLDFIAENLWKIVSFIIMALIGGLLVLLGIRS